MKLEEILNLNHSLLEPPILVAENILFMYEYKKYNFDIPKSSWGLLKAYYVNWGMLDAQRVKVLHLSYFDIPSGEERKMLYIIEKDPEILILKHTDPFCIAEFKTVIDQTNLERYLTHENEAVRDWVKVVLR